MRTNSKFPSDDLETDEDTGPISGGTRPVDEFLADDVTTIAPTATLREAAVLMRARDISLAVVGDRGDIEGVVSERDLVAAIALNLDLDQTTVAQIESDALRWATSTSTVDDVAEEMLEAYLRHLLVRDEDGGLAGVVSMRDLLTAYLI